MPVARNVAKERMAAGKIAFGLGIRMSRSVEVVRAARALGYHYTFIDLEHTTIGMETVADLCVVGLEAGVTPTVRITGHDYELAVRLLDGGAQGIVVPHVDTAEEAAEAVRGCRFPPFGERSPGGGFIQLDWEPMPVGKATELMNQNLLLTVMVENPTSVGNIEEIAAVPGVDVISIGSNDLALAMGIPGEFDHPDLLTAYETVAAAARKNGRYLRIGGVFDPRLIQRSIEIGSRMVMLGHDSGFMHQAMRARIGKMKKLLDSELTA
jgi:2-keto-3-deoxy-L-rhamnonate aldolase RhmA